MCVWWLITKVPVEQLRGSLVSMLWAPPGLLAQTERCLPLHAIVSLQVPVCFGCDVTARVAARDTKSNNFQISAKVRKLLHWSWTKDKVMSQGEANTKTRG